MKYVYLFILCTIVALIISFKNYKREEYEAIPSKDAPLKFVYGLSMVIISLSSFFTKNKNISDKNILKAKLKSVSFGICAFTIIICFGLLFCFTNNVTKKAPVIDDTLPEETLEIVSSESQTDIEPESYDKLKDTIAIFEGYRKDIEKAFLAENVSCYSITCPLNLINTYGNENVLISWTFETDNVIDDKGNIIYENIDEKGCSTLAYANLTLNDVSATLTIPIFISPPK